MDPKRTALVRLFLYLLVFVWDILFHYWLIPARPSWFSEPRPRPLCYLGMAALLLMSIYSLSVWIRTPKLQTK